MKKILFVTIFILTGLRVFAQDAVQDAFIDQLTGTVEIKHPKESAFKAANKGDKIFQETVISTSFKSYAIVKIGGTTITVRPLTIMSLTEIQKFEETEKLNVNLQSGRIRVEVKPPAGTKTFMSVSSPMSTASVRGTSFEFDTNNLYVNEGTVSFSGNKGQDVLVSAGGNSGVGETGQVMTSRDGRNANLMPPTPAGMGAKDAPALGAGVIGTPLSIQLTFK